MSDSEAFRSSVQQLIQNAMQLIDPAPPPPGEFQRYAEVIIRKGMQVIEANRVAEGGKPFEWSTVLQRFPALTAVVETAVPTAEDLAEAEAELRDRVLPATSEAELEEAVTEVIRDPEKLSLATSLREAVDAATGLRGSAPWVVLVIIFYVCVQMNQVVVGALGTAFTVVALMQSNKPGG